MTTVAALALDLPAYDPVAIHGSRIPVAAVRSVTAGLLTATRAKRAALPVMHPGRVDVIGAGSLVLRVLMDAFDVDEVVVERARHPRRHRPRLPARRPGGLVHGSGSCQAALAALTPGGSSPRQLLVRRLRRRAAATSRPAAYSTPDTPAQASASGQVTPGAAGFFGGG